MRKPIISLLTSMLFLMLFNSCSPSSSSDDGESRNDLIWAIQPTYDSATPFSSGVASVYTITGEQLFIDKEGSSVFDIDISAIEHDYMYLPAFIYGVAKVKVSGDNRTYMLSRGGKLLNISISPYDYVDLNGVKCLIPVKDKTTGLFGYINNQRLWYIEPEFYGVNRFINRYSIAMTNDGYYTVRDDGTVNKLNNKPAVYEYSENIGRAKTMSKTYYVDLQGNTIIPGPFDDGLPFSEGFAAVKMDDSWGYIDAQGHWVIEPQYDEAYPFSDNVAIVAFGNSKMIIDKTGKPLSGKLRDVFLPSDISESPYGFVNDYCVWGSGVTGYGLIDKEGKWALSKKYSIIYDCDSFFKLVKGKENTKGVKYGLFLPETQTLIECKYDEIREVNSKVAVLTVGSKQQLLNLDTGKPIGDELHFIGDYAEGLFIAQQSDNGLYGFIDMNGKWVIQPQFENVWAFSNSLAAVKLDGKWGFIANPLVYDEWVSDELERSASLGFYTANDGERTATPDDLLALVASVLERITQEHIDESALWQTLNLDELGISKDATTLTREDAAVIVAEAAKYCGLSIDCLFAFLEDEGDVDKEKLIHVSWVSCFGLLDYDTPGSFAPKSPVTLKDAQIMALRLFETCIDMDTCSEIS